MDETGNAKKRRNRYLTKTSYPLSERCTKREGYAERNVAIGVLDGNALFAEFSKEAVGTNEEVEVFRVQNCHKTARHTRAGESHAERSVKPFDGGDVGRECACMIRVLAC